MHTLIWYIDERESDRERRRERERNAQGGHHSVAIHTHSTHSNDGHGNDDGKLVASPLYASTGSVPSEMTGLLLDRGMFIASLHLRASCVWQR
jgi:hypothetical protein